MWQSAALIIVRFNHSSLDVFGTIITIFLENMSQLLTGSDLDMHVIQLTYIKSEYFHLNNVHNVML